MEHTSRIPRAWRRIAEIARVESPWVRLIAERWRDDHEADLDYWRVERVASVIALPIWRERVLLPHPQFRPGINRMTLDLPGGRVPVDLTPVEAIPNILRRELGIAPAAILELRPLNEQGWIINSSFSNQELFGVIARIDDTIDITGPLIHRSIPCTRAATIALADELECLQCRAVLQEWTLRQAGVER